MASAQKMSFGVWYDFRNPPKWHRPYEDVYAETIEQVVFAESLGYDDAWFTEHHFAEDGYSPSPVIIAAAAATKTKRIRLGTNVLLAPLYHPVRLAEDGATVDIISRGRFQLGAGLGYRPEEFAGYGIPYKERGGRTNEALEIIRRLWEGETVTFRGKYFQIENARLTPRPVQQPRPPIFVGGMKKAAAKRVARYGDGFLGSGDLRPMYEAYTTELRALGKDPAAARLIGSHLWMIVSNDPDKTWNELAPYVLYEIQDYAKGLERAGMRGFLPDLKDTNELKATGILNVMTPDAAVQMLKNYAPSMPCESYCCMSVPPGLPPVRMYPYLELFANKVMPHFR